MSSTDGRHLCHRGRRASAAGLPALAQHFRDDLAVQSGISKHDIEAIEDGKMNMEEGMLQRLATVLKVPLDELI